MKTYRIKHRKGKNTNHWAIWEVKKGNKTGPPRIVATGPYSEVWAKFQEIIG